MVGSFVVSFGFWVTVIPLTLVCLLLFLAYLVRLRNPATVDVCDLLRGADARRMLNNIVSSGLMDGSRRFSLYEAREFMLAIFHDMSVLIAWSRGALHMELVERPWEEDGVFLEDSRGFVEGHRALLAAAKDFRRHAFKSLLKINVALLHDHRSLRWLMPAWGDLSRSCGRGFLALYAGVFKAVVELTVLYDEDYPEQFVKALFKIKDPANEIAALRNAGVPLNWPNAPSAHGTS